MNDHPLVPEPHTEYHCRGERFIKDFGRKWVESGQPPLYAGWRDPGGGWIRWLWFRDPNQETHALHVPSYRDNSVSTKREINMLGYLLGRMCKDDPGMGGPLDEELEKELESLL